jgi:hypothetical protein
MGINLDKMREKLAALRGEGKSGDSVFWRPEDVLCPKRNFGDNCPVCDFASQLWREGVDNNDDHSKKMAKSLFVRQRFFSPVMVRGQEDAGVRVWGERPHTRIFFLLYSTLSTVILPIQRQALTLLLLTVSPPERRSLRQSWSRVGVPPLSVRI